MNTDIGSLHTLCVVGIQFNICSLKLSFVGGGLLPAKVGGHDSNMGGGYRLGRWENMIDTR